MSRAKPFEIPKQPVWEAYRLVKANGGAAGVDEESLEEFERDLKNNLYRIWNRMASGSYFPPPVKAVLIPKKSGGQRTLGVPTVADRIAQAVVKLELTPFRGHFIFWEGGVHDVETKKCISAGVPATDGRVGPVGPQPGRAVAGV